MDFNATIDLIIKDLDEVREIIDDLKKYPGVPVLQIELAKSKCRSATDVISLLKTIQDKLPDSQPSVAEIPIQSEMTLRDDDNTAAANILTDSSIMELEVDLSHPKDPVREGEPKVTKKAPESSILADKFSHLSGSFNEQLGAKKGVDDTSDIVKAKPFSNLPEAIGVNDKFLFIREIFNDNKEAYNQAILRLDSSDNIKDARDIIMSYTNDNKENEAVRQLLDLVKRKLRS